MSKYLVTATWDDAPHLTRRQKDELFASIPPHQRDARTKGVPQLGSGAIYPVPEDDITCTPIELPAYWPRAYGLDVGWNRTAAVWAAIDRETQTTYLYGEYYRGKAEPSVHADAIRAHGDWVPGVIDPAARGRSQKDGSQLLQDYLDLGLMLTPADKPLRAASTWSGNGSALGGSRSSAPWKTGSPNTVSTGVTATVVLLRVVTI